MIPKKGKHLWRVTLLKKNLIYVFYLSTIYLWVRLQAQESMLAQSQTCVQELTNEVKNRCLELREMSLRIHDEEKLLQVNTDWKPFN